MNGILFELKGYKYFATAWPHKILPPKNAATDQMMMQ
jgi:hypothetical protein